MRVPLFELNKNKSGRVAMSTKTSGSTEVWTHLKMNTKIVKVYGYRIMPFLLINTQRKYLSTGKCCKKYTLNVSEKILGINQNFVTNLSN